MNKKLGFVVILTLAASVMGFSNENLLSFGFEYGNFFEKRTEGGVDIETYRGSPGFNFSGYHLWDNFGFFHSHSFLFPTNISSNIEGYDYFFQYNVIFGPAFRIMFNEKMNMNLGIGVNLGPVVGEFNNKKLTQFNLGIGGDIGISFFVNKMVYVNIGSLVSYHFFNITSIGTGEYEIDDDGDRKEIKDIERSKNYNMAGVRPYIKIGLMLK
jgi:hypothetical protein